MNELEYGGFCLGMLCVTPTSFGSGQPRIRSESSTETDIAPGHHTEPCSRALSRCRHSCSFRHAAELDEPVGRVFERGQDDRALNDHAGQPPLASRRNFASFTAPLETASGPTAT